MHVYATKLMNIKCANYIQSTMANVPFNRKRSKTKEIFELIYTDLNGPHNMIGYGGEKYSLSFIDDCSKCIRIFCIYNKSDTAKCLFFEFVNQRENLFVKKIKKLRCDSGKEYLNKELYDFIRSKGI